MIRSLSIKNFIIVKSLNLDFEDGLQVLSGETGAGKSVIAGAIDVALGGKIVTDIFFDPNESSRIDLEFDLDDIQKELKEILFDSGIEDLSEGIFISREISTTNRSRFFLNGRRVTANIVKEIKSYLIDFHSQREQQKIFDNEYQLELLDSFAAIKTDKNNYYKAYLECEQKISKLNKLIRQEKEKNDKIKLYEYQLNEIETMRLQPDEDIILENEINLYNHAEEILNLSSQMEQQIYESENSIYDHLNYYIYKLQDFENDNERIKNSLISLKSSMEMLDESVNEIREMQNIIDFDAEKSEELQMRLDSINNLKSKYKKNLSEIIQYKDNITKKLEEFKTQTDEIEELKKDTKIMLKDLNTKSVNLSEKRIAASTKLSKEIEKNIKKLAIPDAQIGINFIKKATILENPEINDFSPNGQDEIDFIFSANKGKKKQSLKLAASGGELSRFLLTVKKIMTDKIDNRVIIFDEIDTGIGGNTAILLGEFIKNISEYHQVICITHLAQIAAYSNKHFAIEKQDINNKTELFVKNLDLEEKRKEIARMIAGSKSEIALKYADEILNKQELAK